MSQNIAGEVVVIIGTSSGVGEATTSLLAAEGGKFVISPHRFDRL